MILSELFTWYIESALANDFFFLFFFFPVLKVGEYVDNEMIKRKGTLP